MKTVRLIIIGFGVIGKAVAQILLEKKLFLKEKNIDLRVVAICEIDGCLISPDGIDLKKVMVSHQI